MEIRVATLCDFAQVREGLLTVASGGITRVWRSQFPAKLGIMLALIIETTAAEAIEPREIRIRVENEDGGRLAEAAGGFQLQTVPDHDPGEMLSLPLVLDFREVELPAAGRYQIVVDPMTENTSHTQLSFRAGLSSDRGS